MLRHPELRDRFAAIHASFLEPLTDAVRQLADDRGLALPSDVTATQVALAWNAMEVGLGLERLTQPQTVDVVLARRMGLAAAGRGLGRDPTLRRQRRKPAGPEDPMNSTQVRYHRRRLADVAQAMRLARTQISREQRPRARLAQHQQRRLEIVVRHAATHSPFYRRWLAETGALGDGPVDLAHLPMLDRSLLMEHFDELVCDPRLRRDELLDWVGQMTRDQLYLDRYRVLLTSGSSGRPGLFVYDAAGWRSIAAGFVRSADWCHLRPTVPRQRMAWIVGAAGRLTSPAREPPPWRSACTGSCPCRSPCRFRSWSRRSTSSNPPT